MTLRVARHTNQLELLAAFYSNILGLTVLGSFTDHAGYEGIFLGKQGLSWHLEFTQTADPAVHTFDEDELLVFYMDNSETYNEVLLRIEKAGLVKLAAKNPYWRANGVMVRDVDGFGVVIVNTK